MDAVSPMRDKIRNLLRERELSFRDFMEAALYDPSGGYYSLSRDPVGKGGDYVTAPSLSPLFAYALGRLADEFLRHAGDEVSTIVDIGCGDGSLLHSLWEGRGGEPARATFYGVDRSLSRIASSGSRPPALRFVRTLEEVPMDGFVLVIANELYDAMAFTRLVQRGEGLHELTVIERAGELDWGERPAAQEYRQYFAVRGITLADGQFVDLSLDWGAQYAATARRLRRGLVVTLDYGHRQKQLFDGRVRRFGTAAAYHQHRVHRDLLARPGEQDLTAHINFDDLIRAGEAEGLETLYFDRQARFLLALGAADHELLRPIDEMEVRSLEHGIEVQQRREEARRLLLPDGIGDEIRVLIQQKGLDRGEWSFERPLFHR